MTMIDEPSERIILGRDAVAECDGFGRIDETIPKVEETCIGTVSATAEIVKRIRGFAVLDAS